LVRWFLDSLASRLHIFPFEATPEVFYPHLPIAALDDPFIICLARHHEHGETIDQSTAIRDSTSHANSDMTAAILQESYWDICEHSTGGSGWSADPCSALLYS
jgi:hypothetical protein